MGRTDRCWVEIILAQIEQDVLKGSGLPARRDDTSGAVAHGIEFNLNVDSILVCRLTGVIGIDP